MKSRAGGFQVAILGFTVLLFFGTAGWMILQKVTSEKVRWVFDILSASLFVLVLFWLLAGENSVKSRS